MMQPRKLGLILTLLLTHTATAQDLRLFEEPDSDPAEQASPNGPQEVFATGNGQPAYTLRSISRFGNQYQATLINRAGEISKVSWNAGDNAPVANSGFTVVAAGPSTLSLMHPAGDSCITAVAVGVSCSPEGNRSELRLAVAVPLVSNGAPMPVQGVDQTNQGFFGEQVPAGPANPFGDAASAQNGQPVFINPFSGEPEVMPQVSDEEQLARQERQEMRAARLRQFEQQQRIEDSDIPPGMQRVRTPFGDRLMPIRE